MTDPASAIVAIIATAVGAVDGANLPEPVQLYAAEVATAAPAIGDQVQQYTSQLPDPARHVVEDGLEAAATALAEMYPDVAPPVVDGAQEVPDVAAVPPEPSGTSLASGVNTDAGGGVGFVSRPIVPSPAASVPSGSGGFPVFGPWLMKAGTLCDGIKPATIAAIYAAENNFRYGPDAPVSPAGAQGPGQFMPETWRIYGRSVHGDGPGDINSVADSVMASGHYLCDMYGQIEIWLAEGRVQGDPVDLAVAGYNAGLGAVLSSSGMPSGAPDYEYETKPYVAKVRGLEPHFERLLAPMAGIVAADGGFDIIGRAMEFLGLPYIWGGGDIHGPTSGGFDCSGLTSHVLYAATGGAVVLPRTSETQWAVGREVSLTEVLPGDLVFGNWQSGGPGHVGIYIGNGQMIHAPQRGDVVRVGPVLDGMKARRIVG